MSAESLLGKGIGAARAGDKATARQWLAKVVQEEPNRVEGWWWLGQVLDDEAQRRYCLDRARGLDPNYSGEAAVRPPGPQLPEKAPPPASATGQPSGPLPVEAASKPGNAGRPTFASARPPDSWPPAKPSERQTGSKVASGPVPTRPPEPKPHGRPSRIVLAGTVIGGAVLVGLVLIGIVALVLAPSRQGSAPAAFATLPPVWTDTPAPIATPTQTPAPTMPPPTPDPLAGNEVAAQALALMEEEKYEDAIPLWDEVLAQDPTNHAAYYQRALSNLEASDGETILQVYQLRALQAVADADQAIVLSNGFNGDYYEVRGWAYENLGAIAETRVDRARLFGIALENSLRSDSLPSTSPFAGRAALIYMMFTGQCEEGLEAAQRLNAERGGQDAAPSLPLSYALGGLNLCLGEHQAAIDHLDRAIALKPECLYRYLRAESWYLMGDTAKSKRELNTIIDACPSFAGYRYWLRALIRQEEGDTEGALKDLQLGAMNTWGRDGLYLYVQSLIARARGERAEATELLKQAEMTTDWSSRPFVKRFQAELAALGEQPYQPTAVPYPEVTPLAALPENHPMPVPLQYVWLTDGAGPIELAPGEALDLYFVPPQGFTFYDITALDVHLLPDTSGASALEAQLYRSLERRWEPIEVEWGENSLKDPDPYVNTSGDVLLRLRVLGPEPVVLQDIGLEMSVQERSGRYVKYSYRDE